MRRPQMARARWAAPIVLATLLGTLTPAPARARGRADEWWARDKALHFGASAGLAIGGYAAAALVTPREPPRLLAGAGLALTAGVAKEIADRYTGGDPSMRDLAWDVAGTATGLLVAWAIDRLWSHAVAAAR